MGKIVRFDDFGELLTPDSDASDWIEYALNNPDRVLPAYIDIDLEEYGFVLFSRDLKSGLHKHQTVKPKDIFKYHNEMGKDVLFKLSGVSQFNLSFNVYIR